jgi:hypothetical protein
VAVIAAAGALALGGGVAAEATTCGVARLTNGAQQSSNADISADGTTVVWQSQANLTGGNADGSSEVFRRQGGTTNQVTPNTSSFGPSVDGDGNVVAFESNADLGGENPTDTNNVYRWSGGNSFSNISDNGAVGITGSPSINDGGNAIAFRSDANLTGSNPEVNVELFRWTLFGPPFLVQRTNGGAGADTIDQVQLSGHGSTAVFSSTRNLTGANADGSREVFRWDLDDGLSQISSTAGASPLAEVPTVNHDGTVVAFTANGQSGDSSTEVWRWVEGEGIARVTDADPAYSSYFPSLDASGNRVSFHSTADLTGANAEHEPELFRWDANTGATVQVTEGNDTSLSRTSIDGVGARVVFESADPLVGANGDGQREVYQATCQTFPDVPASHQFFTDVEWMAAFGISTGNPDGTYRPTNPVSRSAMAAFLYRLAGEPLGPFPDPGFSDTDGHPFEHEIAWMADAEVAGGYEDGTFRPAAPVSRAAMSAFLYRMSSEPPGPFPNPGFSDVPTNHPFFFEISWMADQEITGGYQDGTFKPAAPVSRQAMAAFLHRFWESPGLPT